MEYNVYCDESCHLRFDDSDVMILGGIACETDSAKDINHAIIDIKLNNGLSPHCEAKWTKISPSNVNFFADLVDYFFDNSDLSFRGYVARGKSELRLTNNISYNEWYYKMYYRMLEYVLDGDVTSDYNLYIDIKDTIGAEKVETLKTYLNNHYHRTIVPKAQLVTSDQIALLQLADILIGALAYKNRRLESSKAKLEIINHIERKSGNDLLSTVPLGNRKANWFIWTPDTWR